MYKEKHKENIYIKYKEKPKLNDMSSAVSSLIIKWFFFVFVIRTILLKIDCFICSIYCYADDGKLLPER